MSRFGRLIASRRKAIFALWAVLIVVGITWGAGVFEHTSETDSSPQLSESALAQAQLDMLDPTGEIVTAVITGEDFFTPALVESATAVMVEVRDVPGVIEVIDAYTAGGMIGSDGYSSLVAVELDPTLTDEEAVEVAREVADILHTIAAPEVLVGGELLISDAFVERAMTDTGIGEAVAIVILSLILIFILGGVRVGLLPIAAAIATVAGALLVLSCMARVLPINEFAVNIATLLSLGLGVDYALLTIMRFREERDLTPDAPIEELIERTVIAAGRAILVSGAAVAIALTGLLLLGDSLLSAMALGGVAAVLMATLAGVTLVPSLVAVSHRHIPTRGATRPRWLGGRAVLERPGIIARLASFAQRRAVWVVIIGGIAMGMIASPIASLQLGSSDLRSLPQDFEERQSFDLMEQSLPEFNFLPVTVVIDAGITEPGVTDLLDQIAALDQVLDGDVRLGLPPEITAVDFTAVGDATGAQAQQVVRDVRDITTEFDVQVTGRAAEVVDTRDHIAQRLPLALGIMLTATFVLLFLLTRSILVPLKAVLLNSLTTLATLGAVVAVFQWGWGASVLGFEAWGAVDVTTPLLIGLFAFGISMDYEVFMVARIHEEWRGRDRSLDPREANDRAVLAGITATGRVVTTAAIAIAVVFTGFAASSLLAMKEVGIGIALAVLLDVTIVRGLLLPATMTLLGRWNWWRPGRSKARPAPRPLQRV